MIAAALRGETFPAVHGAFYSVIILDVKAGAHAANVLASSLFVYYIDLPI